MNMLRFIAVAALVVASATPASSPSVAEALIARFDGIKQALNQRSTSTYVMRRISRRLHEVTALFSPRGRGLQSAYDVWVSDMEQIAHDMFADIPTITSFDQAMTRVQQASCMEGIGLTGVMTGVIQEITSDAPFDEATVRPAVEQLFTCVCSAPWSFSGPQWAALFDQIYSLRDGDDPNMGQMVQSFTEVLPSIFSAPNACSGGCQVFVQTIIGDAIDFGLLELEAWINSEEGGGTGVVVQAPADARLYLPRNVTRCLCGGTLDWARFLTFPYTSFNGTTSEIILLVDDSLSFLLSDGLLCGGGCRDTWWHTMNMIEGIGLDLLPTWVFRSLINDQFSAALPPSVLPSYTQLQATNTEGIACICGMSVTNIAQKVHQLVVDEGDERWSSGPTIALSVGEITRTVMDGTPGAGGVCDGPSCTNVMTHAMSDWARYMQWVAEHMLFPFNQTLFDPNIISVDRLNRLGVDGPACMCSNFMPGATGDIFPYVAELIAMGEASESLPRPEVIVSDAFRAMRLCASTACRRTFVTAFEIVEATEVNPLPGTCTLPNTRLCSAGGSLECTPLLSNPANDWVVHSPSSPVPPACEPCYRPYHQGATHPMSQLLEHDSAFPRTAFWGVCLQNHDCPADDTQAIEVTFEATVQATLQTFNRTAFRNGLAGRLTGVLPDDITLSVREVSSRRQLQSQYHSARELQSGQLVITSTIRTYTSSVAEGVVADVTQLEQDINNGVVDPTAVLGTDVQPGGFTPPNQAPVFFPSPAPPPPPPPPSESGGDEKIPIAAIVGGAAGGVALIVLVIVGVWYRNKRRMKTAMASMDRTGSDSGFGGGQSSNKLCTSCGEPVQLSAKFCTKCGTKVQSQVLRTSGGHVVEREMASSKMGQMVVQPEAVELGGQI